jgi:hypothetical protein
MLTENYEYLTLVHATFLFCTFRVCDLQHDAAAERQRPEHIMLALILHKKEVYFCIRVHLHHLQ